MRPLSEWKQVLGGYFPPIPRLAGVELQGVQPSSSPLADTELSENLCRWKTHELNVKSKVLTVNTMGDGASTYRTPMVSFFFCRLSVHLFDSTDAQIVVLTSPSRSSILSYAEIFLKI